VDHGVPDDGSFVVWLIIPGGTDVIGATGRDGEWAGPRFHAGAAVRGLHEADGHSAPQGVIEVTARVEADGGEEGAVVSGVGRQCGRAHGHPAGPRGLTLIEWHSAVLILDDVVQANVGEFGPSTEPLGTAEGVVLRDHTQPQPQTTPAMSDSQGWSTREPQCGCDAGLTNVSPMLL
jgi:hypothetical protein